MWEDSTEEGGVNEDLVVRVVVPKGAFGASDDDDALDRVLRQIAIAASSDANGEWADKYGRDVDNDTFMMHRYCWCEREDCPWCAGCTCPDAAYTHYIDGKEVSGAEYDAAWDEATPPWPFAKHKFGTPEFEAYDVWWQGELEKRNARFKIVHTPTCFYCTDGYREFGGEPGKGAPNFWYKPTGLKVWWYKHIGRGTEVVGPTTDLAEMLAACMAALEMRGIR